MQTADTASGSNVLEQLTSGAVVMFQAGATYLGLTEHNGAILLTWVSDQDQAIPFTLADYTYSAGKRTAVAEITVNNGSFYLTPIKPELGGLTNPVITLPDPAQLRMVLTSDPSQHVVNLQTIDGSVFLYTNNPIDYVTFLQDQPAVDLTVLVLKS